MNKRQDDIRNLTEAAGKLQEQQVSEYQLLISSLTTRWQQLQLQFQEFHDKESGTAETVEAADTMPPGSGPDFVTRVNKLREAISSVSRQLHSPPLNLKHHEQLSGQEDSLKVKQKCIVYYNSIRLLISLKPNLTLLFLFTFFQFRLF